MSFEVGAAVAVVLIVFAALLAVLKFMKSKGLSFTVRVFSALGMGIVLGVAMQLALGRGSDAAKCALDWMSLVGTGYISLLKMLVMPLIFVAIVGAFTRTEATENLGKIGISVLVVLLGTVAIAAVFGWATIALSGLAGADFTQGTVDASKMDALQTRSDKVAGTTIPQTILSFIPTNVFSDLAGTRSTSTIAVVIFSALVGLAYLKLRNRDSEQADFFRRIIDSLYGIVMCIVKMVIGLTPYGVMALIANVMATSDFAAIVDLGKFIIFSYVAIIAMFIVHLIILAANRVNPVTYLKKAFPVLSFAFVSRTSAGALPMNIETQSKALGVDEATANFAASFGMSIGQNGCAGIYPGYDGDAHRADRRYQRVRPDVGGHADRHHRDQLVRRGRRWRRRHVRKPYRARHHGSADRNRGSHGVGRAADRHGPHRAQRERLHGRGCHLREREQDARSRDVCEP